MKSLLMILMVIAAHMSFAQTALIDREGSAHFFSEAPLEDIEATNKNAIGAFDLEKGTIAVTMKIKDFHFDKSLMEEHFNENYMESERYPNATFTGEISNFSALDFSKSGSFSAKAKGELDIHGVTKTLVSDVKFEISDDTIIAKTYFKVALEDHDIDIPKLVIKNIAEIVDVDAAFKFTKK